MYYCTLKYSITKTINMKKLFTKLMVVAITTTMTFAQKGTVALGVDSRLDNIAWQEYKLSPTVGYFLTDNFMLGIGFQSSSITDEDEQIFYNPFDMTETRLLTENSFEKSMELIPFVRYYFGNLYASAGVLISSSSSSNENKDGVWEYNNSNGDYDYAGYNMTAYENESTSFGMSLRVGYSLLWNDRISIEPSFGITTSSGKSNNTTISKSYDTESTTSIESNNPAPNVFNMGIALGIHLRLGK